MAEKRNKNGISIYEIARLTGFSSATVSRVLNGKRDTSESSRKAVFAAAEKFNFKPATSIRRRTIGLVMDVSFAYYSCYLDMQLTGLISLMTQRGINVEIFTRDNFKSLNSLLLDGLIVFPWAEAIRDWAGKLKKMPRILVDQPPTPGCARVCFNQYQSGRLAAEYLYRRGHQRAAILLDGVSWGHKQRYAGFRDFFVEKTGAFDEQFAGASEWRQIGTGDESLTALLRILQRRPGALFLAGEDRLQAHIQLLHTMNIAIPAELELISMEHPIVSPYLRPPLTSIGHPFEAMQRATIEMIEDQIEHGANEELKVFDTYLIERGKEPNQGETAK